MEKNRRARVLLADDHTVVIEGVRAMLSQEFEMVGVAKNGRDLLRLAQELRPDVVIVDIAMPILNGLEATERLKGDMPECPVIVMSGQDGPTYVKAALRAGARGYVFKTRAEELSSAIRTVLRGKTYLPDTMDRRSLAEVSSDTACPLSPREREVLQLIAEGKSAKEIAALAGVSVRTVEFHRYNIMNKLSMRTTAELVKYAIQEGISTAR